MKNNILLRKRLFFSLLIWAGNVLFWSIVASFVMKNNILPDWFWFLFLLTYAIQAVPYWIYLNKNFRDKRWGNIVLVMSMPLWVLIGFFFFFSIIRTFVALQQQKD